MPENKDELLADAITLLRKMKQDKHLWAGDHGFSTAHREDVNDLIKRHRALEGAA